MVKIGACTEIIAKLKQGSYTSNSREGKERERTERKERKKQGKEREKGKVKERGQLRGRSNP